MWWGDGGNKCIHSIGWVFVTRDLILRQIRVSLRSCVAWMQAFGFAKYMKSLPRKSSKLQYTSNRTANRHRWEGRVDQDERVRGPQGTRQNSSRNFGIRLASLYFGTEGRSERSLATVYQKHSSLRTRKRMYRGWHLTNARRLNTNGDKIRLIAGLYKPWWMSAVTITVLR